MCVLLLTSWPRLNTFPPLNGRHSNHCLQLLDYSLSIFLDRLNRFYRLPRQFGNADLLFEIGVCAAPIYERAFERRPNPSLSSSQSRHLINPHFFHIRFISFFAYRFVDYPPFIYYFILIIR